jgi:hypothetical protein
MPVSSNVNAYNGWFDQAMWGTDESSCDIVATVEYHHQPSPSWTLPAILRTLAWAPTAATASACRPLAWTTASWMQVDTGTGRSAWLITSGARMPASTLEDYLNDVAQGISYLR